MKTQLKLGSTIMHGVGGPQAGSIAIIYEFLLAQCHENHYSYISVNQIDETLDEVIVKMNRNEIYVNVRYPADPGFENLESIVQQQTRLDIMHLGLSRIAEHERKLSLDNLNTINAMILKNKFHFEFTAKTFPHPNNPGLQAQLSIIPDLKKFDFFLSVLEDEKEKCRVHLYEGGTTTYYFGYFFSNAKWKGERELIISGSDKTIEIHILLDSCEVSFEPSTLPENAPFEIFRANRAIRNTYGTVDFKAP
ncbi:MAG: hypothetical protein ABW007_24190 [Chitinophagaceae bacterium]